MELGEIRGGVKGQCGNSSTSNKQRMRTQDDPDQRYFSACVVYQCVS